MTIYTCAKCLKKFENKTWYNRHLSRKTSCEIENNDILESLTSSSQNVQSSSQNTITCEFCQKGFTRIDNLKRHIDKYCVKKFDMAENSQEVLQKKELEKQN